MKSEKLKVRREILDGGGELDAYVVALDVCVAVLNGVGVEL